MVWLKSLSRRKKLGSEEDALQTRLKRCLSTLDITLIGIGHMMGSGIYVTSPVTAQRAGPASIVSFALAGFASMLAALAYAEFGVRYPRAGSAYSYVYFTVGEFFAFIVGWNVLLENTLAMAGVSQSCALYIDSLAGNRISGFIGENVGTLTDDTKHSFFNKQPELLVIVIMMVFVAILMIGTSGLAKVGNVLSVVNMFMLSLIVGIGFWKGDFKNWTNPDTGGFMPKGWAGVFSAASLSFFSFGGFDAISATAEEARSPRKSIPVATIIAMSMVTVLYTSVSASLTVLRNWTLIDASNGYGEAMAYNGVEWAKYLITVGAMCGMMTVSVMTLYTVVRAALSMSEDGLLFKFFSTLSPRTQVPQYSMFVFAAIATAIAVFLNIDAILDMLSIGTLMAYMMVTCGLIIHRYSGTENMSLSLRMFCVEKKLNRMFSQRGFIFLALTILVLSCFVVSFGLQRSNNAMMIVGAVPFVIGSIMLLLLDEVEEKNDNYKMPLMPWLPIMSIAVDCALMSALGWVTWLRLVIWLFVGSLLYFSYGFRFSRLNARSGKTLQATEMTQTQLHERL